MGKIFLDGYDNKEIDNIVLEGENCVYVEIDKKHIDTLVIDDIYNYYQLENERVIDDDITKEEQEYITQGGTMLFGTKSTGKKIKVPYYMCDECCIILKDVTSLDAFCFNTKIGDCTKFINYRNICHLYINFSDKSSIMISLPWDLKDDYINYYQESQIKDKDIYLYFKEVSHDSINTFTPDKIISSINLELFNKIYLLGKYSRGSAKVEDTLVVCVDVINSYNSEEVCNDLKKAFKLLYNTNIYVFDYNMYNTEDIDKKGLLIYSK